jgi:hypothetical protein
VGGISFIAPQAVQDVERQVLHQVLAKLFPDGVQPSATFAHTSPAASK